MNQINPEQPPIDLSNYQFLWKMALVTQVPDSMPKTDAKAKSSMLLAEIEEALPGVDLQIGDISDFSISREQIRDDIEKIVMITNQMAPDLNLPTPKASDIPSGISTQTCTVSAYLSEKEFVAYELFMNRLRAGGELDQNQEEAIKEKVRESLIDRINTVDQAKLNFENLINARERLNLEATAFATFMLCYSVYQVALSAVTYSTSNVTSYFSMALGALFGSISARLLMLRIKSGKHIENIKNDLVELSNLIRVDNKNKK